MAGRKETGKMGEMLAMGFLKKKGYRIIEANFRCRTGEIDIVTKQGKVLVFVEVRARTNTKYGTPEESIGALKMRRLVSAAEFYRQIHPDLPDEWRIDVVAIEISRENRVQRIDLIENAIEG
jgi:putative endonuclease